MGEGIRGENRSKQEVARLIKSRQRAKELNITVVGMDETSEFDEVAYFKMVHEKTQHLFED